jgi:hypothetical protein
MGKEMFKTRLDNLRVEALEMRAMHRFKNVFDTSGGINQSIRIR